MSSARKTQRLPRYSSRSESAGAAAAAAAGPPPGLEELYAAVSAGNISWATMTNLNMNKVREEGLGAALMALRSPPSPKKLSRKEYKKLYAQQAAEAAARRATRSRSGSRSRTPSSEIRRRRASLKKQPAGGK